MEEGCHVIWFLVECNMDGIWNLCWGAQVFVAKIFWDVISRLLSNSGPVGSGIFVVVAMTFVKMTVID